jgi:hypothetical protein
MINDTNEIYIKKDIFLYQCNSCNYYSSRKTDYQRHLHTKKHKKKILDESFTFQNIHHQNNNINPIKSTIFQNINNISDEKFYCICGKPYKYRQGLSVHKKKCIISLNEEKENSLLSDSQLVNMVLQQNIILQQNQERMIKQNNNMNSQVIELMKNTPQTITNNTNYNKTFNLNIFLNQKCKDAMNLMDFVDSLKLQLSDLEKVGNSGYVSGISDIIVKNLQALDIYKRPVHCSDLKREVLYIKDDNQWEKESKDKPKIKKAIKHIAAKNYELIDEFRQTYPDFNQSKSKVSDVYVKVRVESLGGSGEEPVSENDNKIIKNIAKEVLIDKEL